MPPVTSAEERVAFLEDQQASTSSSSHRLSSASSASSQNHDNGYDLEAIAKSTRRDYEKRPWFHRLVSWVRLRPRSLRRLLRRQSYSIVFVLLKYAFMVLSLLLAVTPVFFPSYTRPPAHYKELAVRCGGPKAEPGCANPFNEKVFLSISLYDKGGHLMNGRYARALLELIHLIGDKNVFLSIYENDSGLEGEAALREFERDLSCAHDITIDSHVPLDPFPDITLPNGNNRTKRLAYLSEMRNRALRPIDRWDPEKGIVKYDKVLFLNDIAFRPVEAAHLLFSTNIGPDGRTQYLSTCSLDYHTPFLFYDLYATRDAEGYSNGLPFYPIFSNAGRGSSRADMLAQKDAVRVTSCWSGMVAMQAKYVQNLNETLPDPNFQEIGFPVIDPEHPKNVSAPVRFRYEPEVFFDACECCLFLADVSQAAKQDQANELGVYVNPYVRVSYKWETLAWLPWIQRWERLFSIPHAILSPIVGLPTPNPLRTIQEGDGFMEEVWTGSSWKLTQRVGRNGLFCGVREMQVIQKGEREDDVNWENVKIPAGQTLNFPT